MTRDALEPRLLRAFVAVAEELHFGRAARRLHLSQPPLSMQIRSLEDRLGARLFERDRRHVALTEAGAFLLDRARHLLVEGERACAEARQIAAGAAGVLSIGYTATATYEVLPPLLRELLRRSPNVRVELVELRSALQPDALRTGRIEVGFACGPLHEEGLVETVVARERFVVALPRRHPLARRARLRLRELTGQPFVAVRADIEPAWAQACAAALLRARARLEVVQETDTKIALLGLVAAGVGLAIVSASMRGVAPAEVVCRELPELAVEVPLVRLHAPTPSPRAQALLALSAPPRAPLRAGRRGLRSAGR